MMSNPRKFSEKIAIHQRKLMEEQNAFKQIMGEVHFVKANPPIPDGSQRRAQVIQSIPGGLGPPAWPSFRGGSLPNVFQLAEGQQPVDMSALSQADVAALAQQPSSSYAGVIGYVNPHGAIHVTRGRSPTAGQHYHPYSRGYSPNASTSRSPVRVSPDHQLSSATMYGGASAAMCSGYLLPPAEASWRRASSDPCVHASLMQPNMPGSPGRSSGSPAQTPPTYSPPGAPLSPESSGVGMNQFGANSAGNFSNISTYSNEYRRSPVVTISSNAGSLPDLANSTYSAAMTAASTDPDFQGHMQPSYQQLLALNMGNPYSSAILCNRLPPNLQQLASLGFGYSGDVQMSQSQNCDANSSNPASPVIASSESPIASPQQPSSPSSVAAYYAIQAQLQGFSMASDYNNSVGSSNKGIDQNSARPGVITGGTYLPHYASSMLYQSATPPSYGDSMQQNIYAKSCQQTSPQNNQIPNIVLTNFDENVSQSPYNSGSNELNAVEECEALKMGLDLSDLSDLQLDTSQDCIDAATENALRMDRL